MRTTSSLLGAFLLFAPLLSGQEGQSPLAEALKVERLDAPVGIGRENPLFSWTPTLQQESYRIQVASSHEALLEGEADLWDTGDVPGAASIDIPYAGEPLRSSTRYYWRVCINGASDGPVSSFVTAVFNMHEWGGDWIGWDSANPWDREDSNSLLSARYLRNEFKVRSGVVAATAHICGVGYHEFYLNGEKLGDRVLSPIPSEYRSVLLSKTYDVTSLIKEGPNATGVLLGGGYYYTPRQNYMPKHNHSFGYPKLRFLLVIDYSDGTSDRVVSTTRWKINCDGAIRANNQYDGEIYDARKEFEGWTQVGFDDSKWDRAQAVSVDGTAVIQAEPTSGMKVVETLAPVWMKRLPGGRLMVDFGQNLTGWVKLVGVDIPSGKEVRLDFAEKLTKDGPELDKSNLRESLARDIYIGKGGARTWAPRFAYHGFRYVIVSGLDPSVLKEENLVAEYISDDLRKTGSFKTDDALFNQVVRNAYESVRGTYKGLPMDCPQRSKRLPWLGDRNLESLGETFLLDNNALYEYWLGQIRLSQRADGCLPDVAPAYWYNYTDNISWPSLFVFAPTMLYRQFGNTRAMEENYPSMKVWLDHLRKCYYQDGVLKADRYGDWGVPPEDRAIKHSQDDSRKTDGSLIATAYYYRVLDEMSLIAGLLGLDDEAIVFKAQAKEISDSYVTNFYDSQAKTFGNGTMTANILSVGVGLAPDDLLPEMADRVRESFERGGSVVTSGVIGLQWMMKTLRKLGLDDIAHTLATNRSYPSFGYMVDHGATTIWEYWNGDTILDSSHNHVMLLGDLIAWCYEDLAGIKSAGPAFSEIEMAPAFSVPFNHIKASYECHYGPITSEWVRKKNRIEWTVGIPVGTKASLTLPDGTRKTIGPGTHSFNAVFRK